MCGHIASTMMRPTILGCPAQSSWPHTTLSYAPVALLVSPIELSSYTCHTELPSGLCLLFCLTKCLQFCCCSAAMGSHKSSLEACKAQPRNTRMIASAAACCLLRCCCSYCCMTVKVVSCALAGHGWKQLIHSMERHGHCTRQWTTTNKPVDKPVGVHRNAAGG